MNWKKIKAQIISTFIDGLIGQIFATVSFAFIISAFVTPTKRFVPILLTIIRNPFWLSVLIVFLVLLVIRNSYIESINRLQISEDYFSSGYTNRKFTQLFDNYEIVSEVALTYPAFEGQYQVARVMDVDHICCPECKQNLIEKRSKITGRYIHYCPFGHTKFSNKFSNHTMEQHQLIDL